MLKAGVKVINYQMQYATGVKWFPFTASDALKSGTNVGIALIMIFVDFVRAKEFIHFLRCKT